MWSMSQTYNSKLNTILYDTRGQHFWLRGKREKHLDMTNEALIKLVQCSCLVVCCNMGPKLTKYRTLSCGVYIWCFSWELVWCPKCPLRFSVLKGISSYLKILKNKLFILWWRNVVLAFKKIPLPVCKLSYNINIWQKKGCPIKEI